MKLWKKKKIDNLCYNFCHEQCIAIGPIIRIQSYAGRFETILLSDRISLLMLLNRDVCRWAFSHGFKATVVPAHPSAGLDRPSVETLLRRPEASQPREERRHYRNLVSGRVQPAEDDGDGDCLREGMMRKALLHNNCFTYQVYEVKIQMKSRLNLFLN